MPESGSPIFPWSGASKEEILLLVGFVGASVGAIIVVHLVRKWWLRRREMLAFFAIVDRRQLTDMEEEAVREVAMKAGLRRPSEFLTSIAVFDTLVEAALRDTMGKGDRETVQRRMASFYGARAKLFPEALTGVKREAVREPEKKSPPSSGEAGADTSEPEATS
jgi:hypothetical protein